MYPIQLEYNRLLECYRYRVKNEQGQFVTLEIEHDGVSCWWVCLYIGKRKKGFQYGHQTGKDGIKSLLWAKECLKNFIQKIDKNTRRDQFMALQWDDHRRRDVYEWGLRDLGFKFGVHDHQKVLILKLPKE